MFRVVFGFGADIADAEIESIDVAPLPVIGKVKIRPSVFQELVAERGAVVLVGIGPGVEPDKSKGVRRIVPVPEFQEAVEAVSGIIEGDADIVGQFLLPASVLA